MAADRPVDRAIIGPSIMIKGDVTGEEDLVIQGRVEGKVDLAQHHVTVGANGRVKANVLGRSVTVEGSVEGDLRAEEQIIIRKSGNVRGNVAAPRVTIEDGATFQGSIDMERKGAAKSPTATPAGAPASSLGSTPAQPSTSSPASGPAATPAARPGEAKHPDRSS
jgi:cytoskeletal protein CcmA (bactofilin family)